MLFVLIVNEIKTFNQHYLLKIGIKHCTLSRKQLALKVVANLTSSDCIWLQTILIHIRREL